MDRCPNRRQPLSPRACETIRDRQREEDPSEADATAKGKQREVS